MQQLMHNLANRFVASITVNFFAGAIPDQDSPLRIEHDDISQLEDFSLLAKLGSLLFELLFGAFAIGDVNEGEDHAVDLIVYCAIRCEPREEPESVCAFHFSLDRLESIQYVLGILM